MVFGYKQRLINSLADVLYKMDTDTVRAFLMVARRMAANRRKTRDDGGNNQPTAAS